MTYDYKCMSCDALQEEIHSMNDEPIIKCDKCGGKCNKQFTLGLMPHGINGGGSSGTPKTRR